MRIVSLLFLCGVVFAATTDKDKLRVRESQLRATVAYAAALKAQMEYQAAASEASGVIAELGKRLGCEIDPQTVECKPKPEPVKPQAP